MNTFSKTTLFSVAMLISGSVFAMAPGTGDDVNLSLGVKLKTFASNLKKAASENAAWKKTASFADAGWTKTQSAASTLWTPSFVKPVEGKSAVVAIPAVAASVDADGNAVVEQLAVVAQPAVLAQTRKFQRFAYRSALISSVVLPVVYAVYKKYGKTIATKLNTAKSRVLSKFIATKRALK